ncbi:DEKNAAC105025 [Brettanomyces naardenensis]|uniref:Cysteine protease n=1 Tax=Brettanomyces naardenensis TaxID=13370 RepID=A0A448YRX3_BRENA|nr:DEKNAAC105025 [Brettanomyces naardenensis]
MSNFGLQRMIDLIWDKPSVNNDFVNPLVVLGQKYSPGNKPALHEPEEETNSLVDSPDPAGYIFKLSSINSFFGHLATEGLKSESLPWNASRSADEQQDYSAVSSGSWPNDFLSDVETRIWFTYRSGFPLIPRDPDGPSPLSMGSFLRGTLDLSTAGEGFTTDAGWGCMIRTSQSLLANALLNLHVGRDWRYRKHRCDDNDPEYSAKFNKHWEIIALFADTPSAPFSIQKIVSYGSRNCNKKPGEWFGPSAAAQSIVHICEESYGTCQLKTYVTGVNGDVYEDELLSVARSEDRPFVPILILSGIRLGVSRVNPTYWKFLKKLIDMPQSVGIAGGRPSSSHYFFGFQGDYLFYLDPHVPQKALILDTDSEDVLEEEFLPTVHTSEIRKLHLSQMDPSMLIGLLITSHEDYLSLKESIKSFEAMERFINIYPKRPVLTSRNSAGSELLDGCDFVDLGGTEEQEPAINEYAVSLKDEDGQEEEDEEGKENYNHIRKYSQPVLIEHGDAIYLQESKNGSEDSEIRFDRDASLIDQNDATERFEEIERQESYVRPGSENGIGKFEEIQNN